MQIICCNNFDVNPKFFCYFLLTLAQFQVVTSSIIDVWACRSHSHYVFIVCNIKISQISLKVFQVHLFQLYGKLIEFTNSRLL